MFMKIFKASLLIGAVLVGISSCKKAEEDNDTQSAVDNSICEGEFMALPPLINAIGIEEEGVSTKSGACPAVSLSAYKKFPLVMTLDYGSGCYDSVDNKYRKGKIFIQFNGPWDTTKSSVSISFDKYYVNNINFDGVITIAKNNFSLTTTVTEGKCKTSDWELSWSATRSLTWLEGFLTPKDKTDDVFAYQGNSSGTNREGKKYTTEITSTLVKRNSCKWIEKGTVKIIPEGKAERILDYGDGTCDNKANLTINGNTFKFDLN